MSPSRAVGRGFRPAPYRRCARNRTSTDSRNQTSPYGEVRLAAGSFDRLGRSQTLATVAQSAEHRFRKAGVDGSTPFGGSLASPFAESCSAYLPAVGSAARKSGCGSTWYYLNL